MSNRSLVTWSLIAVLAVLACGASVAFAQDELRVSQDVKPTFVTLPPRLRYDVLTPATPLTTWNGSFVFSGTTYNYNMVGTAPSTDTSTTIPVYIIPLKIVITSRRGTKTTFDPSHVLSNGNTVTTEHGDVADLR